MIYRLKTKLSIVNCQDLSDNIELFSYSVICKENGVFFMNSIYPLHFVDIETTNLKPEQGEIIEVAILTSFDGGRTIKNIYETKIKPSHLENADPKAMEINNYKESEWHNAPSWEEVAPKLHNILYYGIIVGHNVFFDWSWLDFHIRKTTGKGISYLKMDTQALVWEHLNTKSASLKSIRNLYGWSHDNAHTALKDIEDTHKLFKELVYRNDDIKKALGIRLRKAKANNLHVVGITTEEIEKLLGLF